MYSQSQTTFYYDAMENMHHPLDISLKDRCDLQCGTEAVVSLYLLQIRVHQGTRVRGTMSATRFRLALEGGRVWVVRAEISVATSASLLVGNRRTGLGS